jgi:hypothetical protein
LYYNVVFQNLIVIVMIVECITATTKYWLNKKNTRLYWNAPTK